MKLIFILGPTAVGKTAVGIELSKQINAEIISVDSRQIYRQMTIGTAKPTSEEQREIEHHLIDCVDVDQPFSVADFQILADKAISEINDRKKKVVLVGGSGLYFRAIVDGIFEGPGADPKIREKLQTELDHHGSEKLYQRLVKIDPISADRIHPNNAVRVIRALEIYELTGKPISDFQRNWRSDQPRYEFNAFALTMPRETLYHRINERVEIMIENGWIDEVKSLLQSKISQNSFVWKTFGYREIADHLNGDLSLEDAISLTKQYTRNYAKRQLTWFRRDDRIKWLDLSQFSSIENVIDFIKGDL